jgi:hypothetical protein
MLGSLVVLLVLPEYRDFILEFDDVAWVGGCGSCGTFLDVRPVRSSVHARLRSGAFELSPTMRTSLFN